MDISPLKGSWGYILPPRSQWLLPQTFAVTLPSQLQCCQCCPMARVNKALLRNFVASNNFGGKWWIWFHSENVGLQTQEHLLLLHGLYIYPYKTSRKHWRPSVFHYVLPHYEWNTETQRAEHPTSPSHFKRTALLPTAFKPSAIWLYSPDIW